MWTLECAFIDSLCMVSNAGPIGLAESKSITINLCNNGAKEGWILQEKGKENIDHS